MSLLGIFFPLLGLLHLVYSQACTWSQIQPSSTTYTRSVSAPAEFVMTVVGESFADGGRLTWEGAKGSVSDLSIMRYDADKNDFYEILNSSRGNTIAEIGKHHLTFNISISDINLKVSAVSGGCTTNDRSPVVTLDVKYCNLSYFEPSAIATDSRDCGYNCERTFECRNDRSLTFNAVCRANATWSEDEAQCRSSIGSPPPPYATKETVSYATSCQPPDAISALADRNMAWMKELVKWRSMLAASREHVERHCVIREVDLPLWLSLFECPNFSNVTCVDGSHAYTETDMLNCSMTFCKDGKYFDQDALLGIWWQHFHIQNKIMDVSKLIPCRPRGCPDSTGYNDVTPSTNKVFTTDASHPATTVSDIINTITPSAMEHDSTYATTTDHYTRPISTVNGETVTTATETVTSVDANQATATDSTPVPMTSGPILTPEHGSPVSTNAAAEQTAAYMTTHPATDQTTHSSTSDTEDIDIDETTPSATDETTPPATDETTPPATDETRVSATDETTPSATDETRVSVTDETTPSAINETTLSAMDETTPSATDESRSSATDETTVYVTDETTPSATYETTSSATDETKFSATVETTPSATYETTSSATAETGEVTETTAATESTDCIVSYFDFLDKDHFDYIEYNGSTVPQMTSFTVCVWIEPPDNAETPKGTILSYCTTGTLNCNTIFVLLGYDSVAVELNAARTIFTDTPTINARSHMCILMSSTALHYYLNGTKLTQELGTTPTIPEGGVLITGQDQDGATSFGPPLHDFDGFFGRLEGFLLWDRALTDDEIDNMYTSGCTCASSTDAIVDFKSSNSIFHGNMVTSWNHTCTT